MKKLSLVLFMFLFAVGTMLAQRTVTGTITDESGEPLIGASVLVKGTTTGTVTDIDGSYSVSVPEGSTMLVVSYTGYGTQEIELGASNILEVTLAEGITLEEAVVTALGVSREKKTLGYAVQEVGGEAVNEIRQTNFIESLSGKVSGVHIKQSNTMGGSANIVIRGTKSLTNNNQALFVIDGIPMDNNNTNQDRFTANGGRSSGRSDYQNDGWGGYDYGNAAMDINPDDIESISVLKGAAATAVWGSRGANGVILVTTKKGENRDGIGISVNSGVTFSTIDENTMPQHQKLYGGGYGPFYEDPTGNFFYADIDGDGVEDLIAPTSEDASWGAAFDPNLQVVHWDALDPSAANYGEKRPWQAGENGIDYFFRTGQKFTNNVAIDGGNEFGTFRLSYTNVDEEGILPNSEIKRNTLNFSGSYNVTSKLRFDASANYVKTNAVGRYGTGYDGLNVMQSFGQWIQTNVDFARLEDRWLRPDGSQLSWNHAYYDDLHPIYFDNPYWTRNKNFQDDERSRMFGYTGLSYDFNDWLTVSGKVSIDNYTELQNERIAVGSIDQSYFSNFTRDFTNMNTDINLRMDKSFDDWSVTATLGGNFNDTELKSVLGETVGGLIVPEFYSISNSTSPIAVNESLQEYNTNSAYGILSVGWKNMVYLEVTDRYDVSSTLPKDENGYNYYGVSGSLILSELGGLSTSNTLSFAKLRANYAEVGNDAPVYSTISTYSQGTSWGDQALFSVNSTQQNPTLKPERTKAYELGLEGIFWNGRLGFDVAVYKSNTLDQIMPVLVTGASGYTRRWVNGGEIENKGIELSLNAQPLNLGDFTWDLGVNWFKNENEVISLYEDAQNILIYSAWDASINATVGQPYGTIQGRNFVYTNGQKTVDENGYYAQETDADGNVVGNAIIGDINPDWNMGISSNFGYKGLSLRVLFDIQQGGDIYSINTKYGQATGVYEETAGLNDKGVPMRDPVADGGGFRYPNTVFADGTPNDIYVDAFRWGRAFYYNNSPTARYVLDASYVKLREVALAYHLPEKLLSGSPLHDITLSLVGRNLAIISKNTKHFDPEASLSSGNQQGIETGSYPTTRTIGVNLRIGF